MNVRKALVDAKAPKLAPKYLYLSSNAVNDLLALDRFTSVEKYGANTTIMDGELGKIHGFRCFESQNVQTSGSPSIYHCLAYTRDAMVLAMRPLPVADAGMGVKQSVISDAQSGLGIRVSYTWNNDYLATEVTLDVLFGVAAMRSEHLIDFTTT